MIARNMRYVFHSDAIRGDSEAASLPLCEKGKQP
jgi:hypothetical protein